jgi:hypothetical protein
MKYDKIYKQKMSRHKKEYIIELLILTLKREEKRSSLLNRALHLFFTLMADQFNNISLDHTIVIQGVVLTVPYTSTIFKEEWWRPIQKTMYGIDSTTDLTAKMINNILDVLTLAFGTQGIQVSFPNRYDLLVKKLNEQNYRHAK